MDSDSERSPRTEWKQPEGVVWGSKKASESGCEDEEGAGQVRTR